VKIIGIIPARFASSRLPGKPLAVIAGKPMIQHVYEKSLSAKLDEIVVATDDKRIFDAVKKFGGNVVMTSTNCNSGTERCAEVISKSKKKFDLVINIQGDEPLLDPLHIQLLIKALKKDAQIATLVTKILKSQDLFQASVVKVVLSKKKEAMYFSRSAIPFIRNFKEDEWLKKNIFYKHIGMYAYKIKTLKKIVQLSPTLLEQAESLEQLRWLENGFSIQCIITDKETVSVDTPEDLERVRELIVK
jgi:3-deoxy-manno-octulosonate cytidylyltransferase (CMP-KDO synthetase)